MKQPSKNDVDMLELMNKIHAQLIMLDKKMDALMHRPLPETKPSFNPPVNSSNPKTRMMYSAICADCKKECSIPFKPSGDRPVYCQDCFSRRKVISLSKMGVDDKPKEIVTETPKVEGKKKTAAVKKPAAKKKPTPKKK